MLSAHVERQTSAALDFLTGGGEMGRLMRSTDWSATPLGEPCFWPQSLRTAVSLMLNSRYPMFIAWGPQLAFLYNDGYRPIFGEKHPSALGQPFSRIWSEIWEDVRPLVEAAMSGQATWSENLQLFMHRRGYPEEVYFTFSYSPVRDETGGIAGMFCACTETTERVLGERRLRTLSDLASRTRGSSTVEQAWRSIAEVLSAAQLDAPMVSYYTDCDQAQARLAFSTGAGNTRSSPAKIDLADDAVWPIRAAFASDGPLLLTDVERRIGALPSAPWPEPIRSALMLPVPPAVPGEPAGCLIVGLSARRQFDDAYRDFLMLVAGKVAATTQEVRAFEQERRRSESLAALDRAKTAFFSNVSHEFRTPLTLLLGPLEDALTHGTLSAPVHEALELAYRNGLRLQKLVNSLLDFSRIEAGRAQVSFEPTDLATLTSDLASTFRSAIQRAGMALSVECEPLGEPVYVDRDMWEKIVLNLLSNAFKFTLEGTISVRLHARDGRAVLEVEDTGIGISPADLPRLFERFYRVENTRARTQEGSGIGLALVQELVKLHGGEVRVQSSEREGTRFTVSVPLGVAHLSQEHIRAVRSLTSTATRADAYVEEALRWLPDHTPVPSASRMPGVTEGTARAPRPSSAGARVLLADDNADMREYVRRLLTPYFEFDAVADGEAALEHARRQPPDLILSDVMMPKLDGFGLLEAIREDRRTASIPVILLSARAGEEATIEGLDAGADDYLVKPFSARELLARVDAQIHMARFRSKATSALRTSEERFRALVTASSDVVYRMNADWTEMRHLEGRDFIADTHEASRTWLEKYIHPDDRAPVMAAIHQAIRARSTFELEHRVMRVDGSIGWTFSRALPIFDESGEIVEWFGTATDVTERKELEHSLREAGRQKDEFLAMLAHELRNPLAPIQNAGELLTRLVADDEQAQRVVSIVKRQVAHLSRLVDDLLDVSRITQKRIELRREALEVSDIIRQAVETVEPVIRERRHDLQLRSGYRSLFVNGDFARLVQCVVNLLTNAAKYTEPGGTIHLSSREEHGDVLIEVSDNGAGIPADLLPRVFDLFVQSTRTLDRAQGGLGIGLSVVQRLVQMHGGHISAHSDGPQRGSTFSIRLPRVAPPVARPDPQDGVVVTPKRILVVDDNADAANTLSMVLTLDGHEAMSVYTSKDAVEEAQSFAPDVILLDIGLPGMDGFEVARRIRATDAGRSISLVALTGYGQPEDRERALRSGFDEHLVKPIAPAALAVVLAGIGARRLQ
jgi:signal transduction histidine kinase/two-component SAPR family response regulator